jgi:hypothetical protein
MTLEQLQEQCELGQRELMATNYLAAEKILIEAERDRASSKTNLKHSHAFTCPSRRPGASGVSAAAKEPFCLDLVAQGPDDEISAERILDKYPFGQLLVAGWGTIQPALEIRRLQQERGLYVETFLAAAFPTTKGTIIVIVPEDAPLPSPKLRPLRRAEGISPSPRSFL